MAQILPETEVTEVEGRTYINPQAALGESDTFIDNLRQTQQANTQQIAQDTYNLGTAVPSNLGGLMGGEGYWTSRYQTPQTNATVANLRAAAQAKALTTPGAPPITLPSASWSKAKSPARISKPS